jgi:hypothetical protein
MIEQNDEYGAKTEAVQLGLVFQNETGVSGRWIVQY